MTKKLPLLFLFLAIASLQINAQVTIFSEDFEAASGPENIANPYIGWQTGQFATSPPTNNNYFWILDATRCQVIDVTETPVDLPSNYSLAVSQNTPATSGSMPQYDNQRANSTLVYYTLPIDATNYTNLTLDFNWICEGEIGVDFGTVIYSLDASNWSALPGSYEGQSSVQNVTNLDLSVLDGQSFYLGFAWENDRSVENFPSFIIDDINIQGVLLTTCTVPNQPTLLNLPSPTGDTISGSFTDAAIPVSSNYLVIVSPSPSVAPTPVNGTSYNIGDAIGTGTVVDIDGNTVFTATGLNPSSTYDIYIFSYNTACLGAPTYNPINPLAGTISTTNTVYCTPSTGAAATLYIDNVEFLGTLNDVPNLTNGFSNAPSGYQNFTGLTNSIQEQGEGINVFVGSNGAGAARFKAWVDWNKNGVFDNPSEIVYDSTFGILTTTFGFVIPANQPIGDYRIRIRIYRSASGSTAYNFNPCEPFAGNGNNRRLGEAEDYLFTVVESCAAKITSITNGSSCGPGAVDLVVTGSPGTTGYNWYDSESGGNLAFGPGASGTISPVLSDTTTFWVTATDGICESKKRTKVIATINPITSLTFSLTNPTICGENDIITLTATGDSETAFLVDEDFESGGLGVFTSVNTLNTIVGGTVNGTNVDDLTRWQNRTSTFVPLDNAVWFPAISSGFGTNNFVMSTSDVAPPGNAVWESLESPVLDASTYTSLTLSFDIYFSKYSDGPIPAATDDEVLIYVSTGGPRILVASYTNDIGNGTNFVNQTVDLTTYNNANLKFSIDYSTNVDENSIPLNTSGSFGWNDGVAVDNVKLFGTRPLTPSFTWTGFPAVDAYTNAAATIPYVSGTSISTVYVKPTIAQLELSTFNFTATATLSNSCDIEKLITITNNSKIWKGTTNTDWNTASNWSGNSVPDITKCVVIPNGSNPSINGTTDAEGFNLLIKDGARLTQQSNSTLYIENTISIESNGTYNMLNSASLVQRDNVANNVVGTFTMDRTTNIRLEDYVYWSSPVNAFDIESISTNTPSSLLYHWNPSFDRGASPPPNPVPNDYGRWESAIGTMDIGKGYIVRAPTSGYNQVTPNPFTASFIGTPNNGDITNIPISRGVFDGLPYTGPGSTNITADDDNWNLIGNPYPSAISALKFTNDNTNIDGTIYIWTHATQLANNPLNDPFYADYVYNYSDDYTAYNNTGSINPGDPGDLYIGAGQGFFVYMNDDPIDILLNTSQTVTFDNTMRELLPAYYNNVFYRSNTETESENLIERHRIWLDIVSSNNIANTILVGYVQGATNEDDRLYDGYAFSDASTNFYSIADEKEMAIQGRALPFEDNDLIQLGITIAHQDNYSIAINTVDGLFLDENQHIYLEDTYSNYVHNLKDSPYTFNSDSGTFNDRFILRYTSDQLSIDDVNPINGVKVFEENEAIVVKSDSENIQSIEIYDLLGRILFVDNAVNLKRFIIKSLQPTDSALFLKIKLVNGHQKIEKIIF